MALGGGALLFAVASGRGAGSDIAFIGGLAAIAAGLVGGAGSQARQRRADGRPYAGPSPVLVFGAALGLTLVAGFAIEVVVGIGDGAQAVLVSVIASAAFSLGLVGILVVATGALSWREMGFRLPRAGEGSALGDVAWGVALAIPTLLAAGTLAALLVALLGVVPGSPLPPSADAPSVLANLVAAAIIAPLWEEAFFRGFVTTAWSRTDGPRAAIVRGAAFFALIHVITLGGTDLVSTVGTAVIAFVVRLPVGLVLGWLFLRRGTLIAPVALHATYNAIPVLLLGLGGGLPSPAA